MAKSVSELELLITASNEELKRVAADTEARLSKLEKTGTRATKGIADGFKSALPDMTKFGMAAGAAGLAIGAVTKAFNGMLDKETALADFSAITGVTGERLKEFGVIAEDLAVQFGTSTTDNINAFKLLLSALGPEIASNADAMKIMTENVNTLAKASGLDATASVDALTSAMLQFGVDLSDPIAAAREMTRMMNIMAAGAKEGAAEIPDITETIRIAGLTASNAGLSFEEFNMGIQIMAKGALKGSEGGTAFRNTLIKLQAPTVEATKMAAQYGIDLAGVAKAITKGDGTGLVTASKLLAQEFKKVGSTSERAALLNKIFGETAQDGATLLIKYSDSMNKLQTSMTGTNTATEQMAVNMDTNAQKMKRFMTFIEVEGIGAMERYTGGLVEMGEAFTSFQKNDIIGNTSRMIEGFNGWVKASTLGLIDLNKWLGITEERAADKQRRQADTQTINKAFKGMQVGFNIGQAKVFRENAEAEKKAMARAASDVAPKEGDISADGKMIFRNGAWVPKPPKTGGGKKLTKAKEQLERLGFVPRAEDMSKTVEDLVFAFNQDMATQMGGIAVPDIAGQWQEELDAGFRTWYDNIDATAMAAERRMIALADVGKTAFETMFSSIGSAIMGGQDALKEGFKSILLVTLEFLEKEYVAAGAAVAIRTLISGSLNLFTDVAGYLAASAGIALARSAIKSWDVGSWNIPADHLAMVHAGETIVPKPMAESIRKGEAALVGGQFGNISSRIAMKRNDMTVNANIGYSAFESGYSGASYSRSRRVL